MEVALLPHRRPDGTERDAARAGRAGSTPLDRPSAGAVAGPDDVDRGRGAAVGFEFSRPVPVQSGMALMLKLAPFVVDGPFSVSKVARGVMIVVLPRVTVPAVVIRAVVERSVRLLLRLAEDLPAVQDRRVGVHVHREDVLALDVAVARRQVDRPAVEVAHAVALPATDHEAHRVAVGHQRRGNHLGEPGRIGLADHGQHLAVDETRRLDRGLDRGDLLRSPDEAHVALLTGDGRRAPIVSRQCARSFSPVSKNLYTRCLMKTSDQFFLTRPIRRA